MEATHNEESMVPYVSLTDVEVVEVLRHYGRTGKILWLVETHEEEPKGNANS